MQFFELLLIVVSFMYTIFFRRFNRRVDKRYLLSGLVIVFIVHLIFEGYRWQMIPAYILWFAALITAFRANQEYGPVWVTTVKGIGLVVTAVLAILLPSVLPVFELPQPTGDYHVGTRDIQFEMNRPEIITPDENDYRKIMLKVWYPTNESNGPQDLYADKGGRHGFAQKYGLPKSSMNYLDKIDTHVYRDVEIANEIFPVLIFSHGYNSKANGYYAILSELASHGYVVFAINHTFESTGTTFDDKSEVYFDYQYAQKIESGTWETISPTLEYFHNGTSFRDRHPAVKKVLLNYFVGDIVDRWAQDIVAVSNEIVQWNTSGFFKGKLDVEHIGVLGHSRGGAAAGHSLLLDSPIKAGVNLDGVQWGKIVDTTFHKPFLFVSADWPREHEDLNSHAYINKGVKFYQALLKESAHSNFMDIPLMIPVNSINQAGSIDSEIAIEATNSLLLSFFNQELKGQTFNMNTLKVNYEFLELNFYDRDFSD